MPITPQQAYNKRIESTDEEYKRHVKEIDEMLVEGDRTYACSLFSNGTVRQRIVDDYREAGWDVEQVGDFRDGDFLRFSEPRW